MSSKCNVCAKCRRKIQDRRFLNCTLCKKTFDIECANVSEKLFNLMDRSRKSLWTCEKCIKRKNKPTTSTPIIKSHPHKETTAPITQKKSTSQKSVKVATDKNKTKVEQETVTSMQSSLSPTPSQNTSLCQQPSPKLPKNLELASPEGTSMADVCTVHEVSSHRVPECSIYVTQRRKRDLHEMSLPIIASTDSSLSDSKSGSLATKSLPDLSTLQNQELEIMKNEIYELKLKLEATENEMDNLMLENKSMAMKIKEQDQKIRDLLTICSTTTSNKKKKKNNKKYVKKDKAKQKLYQSLQNHDANEKCINTAEKLKIQKKPVVLDEETDHTTETPALRKTKVVVIADQQGQGAQQALQRLLDPNYVVTCFWKDGACLQEVLNTCSTELCSLTSHDFVVVMGGMNENNPLKLKTTLLRWLNLTCHTNIVMCGLPCNANLNVSLNREIELICKGFTHCAFVRLQYNRSRLGSRYFLTDLCFGIFREIIHVSHLKYKPFSVNIQGTGGVMDHLDSPCSSKSESCLTVLGDFHQTPNRRSQTLPFL